VKVREKTYTSTGVDVLTTLTSTSGTYEGDDLLNSDGDGDVDAGHPDVWHPWYSLNVIQCDITLLKFRGIHNLRRFEILLLVIAYNSYVLIIHT
jgi:hypothetical protein